MSWWSGCGCRSRPLRSNAWMRSVGLFWFCWVVYLSHSKGEPFVLVSGPYYGTLDNTFLAFCLKRVNGTRLLATGVSTPLQRGCVGYSLHLQSWFSRNKYGLELVSVSGKEDDQVRVNHT